MLDANNQQPLQKPPRREDERDFRCLSRHHPTVAAMAMIHGDEGDGLDRCR
jgi:hypothetical protein